MALENQYFEVKQNIPVQCFFTGLVPSRDTVKQFLVLALNTGISRSIRILWKYLQSIAISYDQHSITKLWSTNYVVKFYFHETFFGVLNSLTFIEDL